MAPAHRARPQPGQSRSRRSSTPRAMARGAIIPACSACWRGPTSRARAPSSRICSRSRASPRSAAARRARSPTVFWNRRRCATAPASRPKSCAIIERFLRHRGRSRCGLGAIARAGGRGRSRSRRAARRARHAASASSPRSASTSRRCASTASFTRNLDYYTGFVFEAHDRARPRSKTDRRRRALRPAVADARRRSRHSRRRRGDLGRSARQACDAERGA